MENHDYDAGRRDGRLDTLEQTQVRHDSRLDGVEKTQRVQERVMWMLMGALGFIQIMPLIREIL